MNKEVLLIDDDPIFHIIFSRMIKKVHTGLTVNPFLNGKLALDYLDKNYSSNKQYVILLDINMPIKNGWQFLDGIIKKGLCLNNNVAIYIVTSSTDHEDIKQAKNYSMVKDMYSKPLSINSLTYMLQPLIKD